MGGRSTINIKWEGGEYDLKYGSTTLAASGVLSTDGGGFAGLFEVGIGAVADAKGASVYDAYMTQAMDVGLLADYTEDLAPRIHDTPELEWGDIMMQVRRTNAVGHQQVALPFDFDFLNFILRDDLVARYHEETNKPEPRTFEELADYGEYFMGEDLNADGIPDFGFCALNGAGPAGPQALMMQVAASKIQYLGTQQGLFFEPSSRDATPLVDNPAFKQAAELTRRMWMASLDSSPGGWQYLHETAWLEGRCAAYIWLSGSVSLVTNMRDVGRCDGSCDAPNATYVWKPTKKDGTYWAPKRIFPPGSEEVLVRDLNEMRKCTAEVGHNVDEATHVTCPHLDPARDERGGSWINRVPYFYSAYQHASISINAKAPQARRDMVWDFAVFANVESLPVISQKLGPTYLDPFRRSQLNEDADTERHWMPPWSRVDYDGMRATLLWAGSSANAVPGLALADRDGFEYSLEKLLWQYFLEVAPCANHVACKCKPFVGGPEKNKKDQELKALRAQKEQLEKSKRDAEDNFRKSKDQTNKVKLSILYPATTGRNFDEILRVIDSLTLTKDKSLATPADWRPGDRCIVAPSVKTEDAAQKFEDLV